MGAFVTAADAKRNRFVGDFRPGEGCRTQATT